MLFPLFPLNPHRLASPSTSPPSAAPDPPLKLLYPPFRDPASSRGVPGREIWKLEFMGLALPPSIADTEEWAHLTCFRMAEVTVTHSVIIRAAGSTAMAIALLDDILTPSKAAGSKLLELWPISSEDSMPRRGTLSESIFWEAIRGASLLMIYLPAYMWRLVLESSRGLYRIRQPGEIARYVKRGRINARV